jgi:hypothetical protein
MKPGLEPDRRGAPGPAVRVLLALVLTALAVTPHRAAPTTLTLGVEGRSSAHVSLAADGSFVAAVWSASLEGGATDIYAATSRDRGLTFSAPVRVNTTPGDARVNGEQPPRAALMRRPGGVPAMTVVWTAKGATGTKLQTARSADGGRTFGRAALVPGTDVAGNRGWEAITADDRGNVHLAWLDHRRLARNDERTAASHHHQTATPAAQHDGVAMAQLSELYVANMDGAAVPRGITGGVCYCCKTALSAGTNGALYAAWRHVYPGNLRDIAFSMSRDAGRTFSPPVRVSEDGWRIEGCPDDGPAMAVDARQRVHLVWPTLVSVGKEQTIGLFYAMSADGRAFGPRVQIPTQGLAHHPQIAMPPNGPLIAAWDELNAGKRQVVMATAPTEGGSPTFRRTVVEGSDAGLYPSVVATGSGMVLAWTAGAGPKAVVKVRAISSL